MNIFTKLDRFFHPSKYKDDRITKPLALVKEKDYVFVLVLRENPFKFQLTKETLTFYLNEALYGADIIKGILIKKIEFSDSEYWSIWVEEPYTCGGRKLEIKLDRNTKGILSNHSIAKDGLWYYFVSTNKKYLAKTLRQVEKNLVQVSQVNPLIKQIKYQQLVEFKKKLSSLRFKLMRI